jgi:hypothetical protein
LKVSSNHYRSSKKTNWENLKISWIFYLFWHSGQSWPLSTQTMHIFVISKLFATRTSTLTLKILILQWKFSIFKADARVEDLLILKSFRTKVGCNTHVQLLRPQGFWISQKTQITPPYCTYIESQPTALQHCKTDSITQWQCFNGNAFTLFFLSIISILVSDQNIKLNIFSPHLKAKETLYEFIFFFLFLFFNWFFINEVIKN